MLERDERKKLERNSVQKKNLNCVTKWLLLSSRQLDHFKRNLNLKRFYRGANEWFFASKPPLKLGKTDFV